MRTILGSVGIAGVVRQLVREVFEPRMPALGLLPLLRSKELLGLAGRPGLLRQIDRLLSMPRSHLESLFHATISSYARFVQQLPASEAHHHAGSGGMLDHGLEVVANALALRRGYLLPQGAEPERLARSQDLWTYAVFTAALLHDIGKVAVDQRLFLFDARKRPLGIWDPWQGPMDRPIAWYRVEFVRGRTHGLHERVAPLLARFVVPTTGISWLTSDREVLAAWVATISGDREQAGVLGEIIGRADGESVARNLGAGESVRLPTARATPLHEKILIALRYLIDEGELPLNRNGAAGWFVGDDLWLVSKRAADAVRAHLMREGHDGIPTRNDRLFDVLQEHGLAISNGERAIWRARVAGDGWAHELTMLRVSARRVWPDLERRPKPFLGSVTPMDGATEAADTEQVQQTDRAPPNEVSASSHSGAALAGDTEAMGPVTSSISIKVAVPGIREVEEATNAAETTDLSDVGQRFLAWLKEGVSTRRLQVNTISARVHMVPEGALLVSPGIFKDFAAKHPEFEWSNVQKRFQKLKLHRRTDNGTNIHRYSVVGARKRSSLNGLLIPDAAAVFGTSSPPPANPHLSQAR